MTTYNCKHSGDEYRITKFNRDGDTESSYLCSHAECTCPAGSRPTCRHRQMLPAFLDLNLVNSYLFLDWDNGRRVVDFQGQPATLELAPQALTDTPSQLGKIGSNWREAARAAVIPHTEIIEPSNRLEGWGEITPADVGKPVRIITPAIPDITPTTPQWRRF